jgi:F0F1-type ATP synthase membrane subunit a
MDVAFSGEEMGLGLFVSFMQAFIFTVLSMIYISGAVTHAEEH